MKHDRFPKIQSPCPKRWSELDGDNERRFCSECQLHVHNLSAMSTRERSDFLRSSGRKCGAYPKAPETQTVRPHSRRPLALVRIFRPAMAGLAFLVALFASGCATTYRKDPNCPAPDYKAFTPAEKGEGGKEVMTVGMIVEERPLWKRILWPWGE